eukprot:66097-Rhodomonas_salina.1
MLKTYVLCMIVNFMCIKHKTLTPPRYNDYCKSVLRTLPPTPTPTNDGTNRLERMLPLSFMLSARKRPPPAAIHDMHNIMHTTRPTYTGRKCACSTWRTSLPSAGRLLCQGAGCQFGEYKGVFARAALYMVKEWGCDASEVVWGGEDTLWRWHTDTPPSSQERLHNYLVLRMQKNTNPFVSNATDPILSLEELHENRAKEYRKRNSETTKSCV